MATRNHRFNLLLQRVWIIKKRHPARIELSGDFYYSFILACCWNHFVKAMNLELLQQTQWGSRISIFIFSSLCWTASCAHGHETWPSTYHSCIPQQQRPTMGQNARIRQQQLQQHGINSHHNPTEYSCARGLKRKALSLVVWNPWRNELIWVINNFGRLTCNIRNMYERLHEFYYLVAHKKIKIR